MFYQVAGAATNIPSNTTSSWSPPFFQPEGLWMWIPAARIPGCICPPPDPSGRVTVFGVACTAHVTC